MVNLGALASFRGCLFCDDENTTVITGKQTPWVLLWHRQEKRWYRPHCREDQKQADEDFYGYVCSQHGNQETMADIQNQLNLVPCFSFPSKKIPHFDIYFISRGGDKLNDEQTSVEMDTISAAGDSFSKLLSTQSLWMIRPLAVLQPPPMSSLVMVTMTHLLNSNLFITKRDLMMLSDAYSATRRVIIES
jgi:hypothetical protein